MHAALDFVDPANPTPCSPAAAPPQLAISHHADFLNALIYMVLHLAGRLATRSHIASKL